MDTTYIVNFYNNYDEDNRLALRHGSVEFLTTMRYIEKYLKPNSKIIEIGAGTGRYSHALARQGYAVDAAELVEHNIEVFKKNTLPNESITIRQGNAMDDETFQLYLKYHFSTCEREDFLGVSSHAVDIFQKNSV